MTYTSEQQIENVVKRKMKMLERALIRGDLTKEGYDLLVQELEDWTKNEYSKLKTRVINSAIDYRIKTQMPIRDMQRDGRIYCLVDIYGWNARDVCIVPGGSDPMHHAVRRLGLDPSRYQASVWDADVRKMP
jgi:hypothetical protein